MQPQQFTTTLQPASRQRGLVVVPFDPDVVWASKPQHHITGTVNGFGIRAVIEAAGGQRGFMLGPAWLRDCRGVSIGDVIEVRIAPEGPQRDDLAEDVAAALTASPAAGAFFDGLAQFYRKAYLRWIEGTSRRPAERARRVAEVVALLEAGIKQRPKP